MSIRRIFELGDDALGNLWEISFLPIPFLPDLESAILRITNLTIPGSGANTYEVGYQQQTLKKVGGKVDGPNEFSFTFRVDRNWLIYKAFLLWKNAVANPHTGVIGPDGPGAETRTDVNVWAIDSDGSPLPNFGRWSFRDAFVQNVGDVSFDYGSGDPITVDITMGFVTLDDTALGGLPV